MKALAVRPLQPDSASVVDLPVPVPAQGQVLVSVLEVGLCGTDGEINAGLYGEAPKGAPWLVLGHEVLGELEDGRLVVPMVRRPCPDCPHCREANQDMCSTGAFTELGIKGLHGGLTESFIDDPRWLIPVPPSARHYAVLTEPMSVFAKGLDQARKIQSRLRWEPKRALVLGAGPIGLLAAMALRCEGWEVTAMARSPEHSLKGEISQACGARYVSATQTPITELLRARYDFIFEVTGSAPAAFECLPTLAVNGVLCLTSITAGDGKAVLPVDRLNFDLVLGNRVVFGTVNAHRRDYVAALEYLGAIEQRFPGLLKRLITSRVGFDHPPRDLFALRRQGIKTVFEIGRS